MCHYSVVHKMIINLWEQSINCLGALGSVATTEEIFGVVISNNNNGCCQCSLEAEL